LVGEAIRIKKVKIKKRGKLPISRRYDLLPLLPSDPDGVHRELAVWNLPQVLKIINLQS